VPWLQLLAPARSFVERAGVILLLTAVAAGCEDVRPGGAPLLELADDTIRLERGTALIEVQLRVRGGVGEIEPARVSARPGDVVRFVAADALGHSVRFDTARLGADAAAFLEETNQLASPPLLTAGAAWVVSLAGAPAGEYPFHSPNHGSAGVLDVRP
jgi:plastocyanin